MTKKFIFLILMCLLGGLIPMNVMAQETVTIDGNGAATSDEWKIPFATYYTKSFSQSYYLSNEINKPQGSTIKEIAVYISTHNSLTRNIRVYLTNTTNSEFLSTNKKSVAINTTTDEVFSGDITLNTTGWFTIVLDKEFSYEGDNILVTFLDNTNVNSKKDTEFKTFKTQYTADDIAHYRTLYKTSSVDPSAGGVTLNNIDYTPQIKFIFKDNSSTPTPPTVTLNTPENNATGIFNPSLNFTLDKAGSYELKFGTTNPPTETVLSQSENIPSNVSYQTNLLNPNTPYYWQVSATNDDGTTTSEVFTFTTKEFAAPGAITDVYPANDAINVWCPRLTWTFGDDTESYRVCINDVWSEWVNTENAETAGYNISYSDNSANEVGKTYSWKIESKNSKGTTISGPFKFTNFELPEEITNAGSNGSKITWTFAENVTQYRVLFNISNGLEYVVGGDKQWVDVTDINGSFETSNLTLVAGNTYKWCVDVKNDAGEKIYYNYRKVQIGVNNLGLPIYDEIHEPQVTVYEFTAATILPAEYSNPENGATNLTNPTLSWNYNGTPEYYQVLMGTSEDDLEAKTDWLAAEGTGGTFQTENLNNATEYYWQVNVKTGETVMEGEVWSFSTTKPIPTNVTANPVQIVPTSSMTYGSTTISWDAMDDVEGYNVYLGTSQLNTELITETSFVIEANSMKLTYNMDPGYDIFVQAVYEIGESDMSEAVNVKVTGFGYFRATIYDNSWGRLKDATVTLTCTEDEFGNVYNGDGREYSFKTDSNGEAFETVEMPDGSETTTNTSLRVFNGTYAVVVEKENYSTFNGSVEITNGQTSELYEPNAQYPGVRLTPDNSVLFDVILSDVSFESINVNLEGGASAGQYHVYLSNGTETTDLGMKDFVTGGSGNIYFTYLDWGTLRKGSYLFGVAKVESQINWSDVAFRNYDVFETTGSWSEKANWRDKELPGTNAEVYVLAAATIDDEVEVTVNNIIIKETGSLTINGSLTANNVTNLNVGKLIINDGAQLRQNNSELRAKFVMDIKTPTNWSAIGNTDGWQFIASPFTNAAISSFTNVTGGYDLFKFDGTKEKEWVNQNKENEEEEDNGNDNIIQGGSRSGETDFETSFVNGRGYLASYETATEATLSGTVNSASEYSFTVRYKADGKWENFYLLGNPFTFDMDWNNVQTSNLADGFVTIDPINGYVYHENGGTIAVGDGFFVKAIAGSPTIAYNESTQSKRGRSESINLIATGKAGSDNVIINLNEEKEGFNKFDNFNKNIASIFVSKENKRYGIASYDKDVTEIPVCFDAKQMGNYTIAAKANGKFETLTLVDRFTGIETNLLVEDYHFTATSSDNHDRFIIKMVNGQQTTDNSHFAYVSGEDLIIEVEGSVEIIDMMGRVVYSSDAACHVNRINVSAFNNAAYLIRVVNEEGVKVQKLIVNSL